MFWFHCGSEEHGGELFGEYDTAEEAAQAIARCRGNDQTNGRDVIDLLQLLRYEIFFADRIRRTRLVCHFCWCHLPTSLNKFPSARFIALIPGT